MLEFIVESDDKDGRELVLNVTGVLSGFKDDGKKLSEFEK